jgi:PAS domain S-box-containing protein
MRDVTERKRAENELRQSEERFRLIAENVADLIAVLDLEGRRLYNSPSYKELFGEPDAMRGTLSFNEIHPDDREKIKQVFQETVRTGRGQRAEFRFLLPNGRVRFIESQGSTIRDEAGKPIRVLVVSRDVTERKQAGEALRASELRYRRLFESAKDGILILESGNGRILDCNPYLTKLLGYSKQELLGKELHEIGFLRDQAASVKSFRDLQRSGYVRYEDLPLVSKLGQRIDVEFVSNVYDVGNQQVIQCNIRNITDRKRAEEEIAHLASFPRLNPHPVIEVDLDGRVFFTNDAALQLLPELVHKAADHPFLADWPAVADACRRGADLPTREVAVGDRWYQQALHYVQDARRVRIYSLDITERKRNEEALGRSEASYRSLILGATYGIFRCDVEGKFVTVNPALLTMLGYESEAELLAANLVNDINLSAGAGAQLLREKGRVEGMQAQWKRKDGASITVRLSGRTVLDGQETLQGFEIIAEDVTARSRLEDQLRQAQKMEAVGQLAGGIAHDFNNLLTIINGYSQLLLDRMDSADTCRGFADEVKRAGERAAALTRQLLAFSRRQVLAPQILDLNTVVTGVEKMLKRLIGEDIQLLTALDVRLGPVRADPGQIEQVILNLAVNARDAMPKGGKLTLETANVELDSEYVETHPLATSGPHVMLAVSDNGCGMDRHTLSHIFEPFFTTKEPGKGTGLGLATVYGIVKQSGGNIWAYSEPGKGTTFKIYLPRVQEAVTAAAPAEGRTASPRGSETILVVEDDPAVRPLVRGVLLSRGYSVLEASRGDEALSVSESHRGPIKLLVTDIVMPGMNGRDLAEQLLLRHPETRVLYMSGYTNDAIVHHGVLAEGAAFLQKPFTPDALARKVREVLDAPQPARQ